MKTLWLIRHAKSSWSLTTLPDHERPLNERGYRDAHEMPARVLAGIARPTHLWVSPAVRTYTTAVIMAAYLRISPEQFTINQRLYESSVQDYLAVLQQTESKHTDVLLFGHNPVITELTNLLSGSDIANVPTCGIVRLQFDSDNWKQLGPAGCSLISFDFPKKPDSEITNRDA